MENKPYLDKDFFDKRPMKIIKLAKSLTPFLNELHELDHDHRFWLRILDDYLMSCVNRSLFYEKGHVSEFYTFSVNSWTPPKKKIYHNKWLRYNLKAFLNCKTSIKQFMQHVEENSNIALGIRGKVISEFEGFTFVKEYYPLLLWSTNKSKRIRCNGIARRIDSPFERNVFQYLPKFAVEYFTNLYKKAVIFDPENKVFHFEHINSPFTKLFVAKYKQNGSELWEYQGGGFAGWLESNPGPIMYEVVDRYITYGWKLHPKDEPGSPHRLIQFKRNYLDYTQRKSNKTYDLVICFSILAEPMTSIFKEAFSIIDAELDREKYSRVLLRPRPKGKRLKADQEIRDIFKPDRFYDVDNGTKSMAEVCASAKVVVQLSHPSTNFVECLFSGIPILSIDTSKATPSLLAESIKPILVQNEIMFDSAVELVDFLNSTTVKEIIRNQKEPNEDMKAVIDSLTSKSTYK